MAQKPEPETHSAAAGRRPRFRARISTVLTLGFGGLVFTAVAAVLAVALWSARQNSLDRLSDKAESAIDALAERVRAHLDPVSEGNAFLARLISRGDVDPSDHAQLVDYMTGTMAATPQVRGIGYIDTRFQITRATRSEQGISIRLSDRSGDRDVKLMIENTRARPGPYWDQPFWSDEAGLTMLNRRAPVRRNGKLIGVLVSAVSVGDLSRYLARKQIGDGNDSANRFVLYGSDTVLAHPAMIDGKYPLSDRQPLPSLSQVGDPVLARMWDGRARRPLRLRLTGETNGHGIAIGDDVYLILYRRMTGYGPVPLRVGAYVRRGAPGLGRERNRLFLSAAAGLLILLIAVAAALALGRAMSRPVRNLALAAGNVAELEFDQVPRLRRSRLRELDEAAVAFNAMVAGLKWFETYVPRTLVRNLLRAGEGAVLESEERPMTVMFTDIHSFTGLAEDMTTAETAAFLNHHFSLISACVEAEQGTVDKYMGDSMMAFWGAPQADEDHVRRACRTALAIRRGVSLDNDHRARRGEPPVRLRIGVHTGPVIVGNIGAPGRINYTLVGDTVNIAQRLQELAKELGSGGTVEILVSADVAGVLGDRYRLSPLGARQLRGRTGEMEVLRLE